MLEWEVRCLGKGCIRLESRMVNKMKLEQAIVVGEELAVRFIDGVEIYLPLRYLRAHCPCAACQQKRDTLGNGVMSAQESSIPLSSVDLVGGYAVRLAWSDGHGSGIYSFDFLQRLEESFRETMS